MGDKEYYHTCDEFTSQGLVPFLKHALMYLNGVRTVPVVKSNMMEHNREIMFTFSNDLLKAFIRDSDVLRKPYEVALKYGFRGYSRGGKNGIFLMRESDGGLLEAVGNQLKSSIDQVVEDLDVKKDDINGLEKVKIVWHMPAGERVVGLYNTQNDRIIFLGFGKY